MVFCSSILNVTFPFTNAAESAGAQDIPPKNMTVGGQNVPPQNRLLWPILSLLFWETAGTEEALKSRPFMKRHLHPTEIYLVKYKQQDSFLEMTPVEILPAQKDCPSSPSSLVTLSSPSTNDYDPSFLQFRIILFCFAYMLYVCLCSCTYGYECACMWYVCIYLCRYGCVCVYGYQKPLLGVFHSCFLHFDVFIYFWDSLSLNLDLTGQASQWAPSPKLEFTKCYKMESGFLKHCAWSLHSGPMLVQQAIYPTNLIYIIWNLNLAMTMWKTFSEHLNRVVDKN